MFGLENAGLEPSEPNQQRRAASRCPNFALNINVCFRRQTTTASSCRLAPAPVLCGQIMVTSPHPNANCKMIVSLDCFLTRSLFKVSELLGFGQSGMGILNLRLTEMRTSDLPGSLEAN